MEYKTIDGYINIYPKEIQKLLTKMRRIIKSAAPGAVERISYGMPSFWLNGTLAYFAVCKNHIGFYPTASGITNFRKELSSYKGGKGSVQFPLDKPIPYGLIEEIVKFRVNENLCSGKVKKISKKSK